MSNSTAPEGTIATIGIDLGKNTFHLIGMMPAVGLCYAARLRVDSCNPA